MASRRRATRGKAVKKAPPPAARKPKDWKTQNKHLFSKDPKNFGIGGSIQPKRDLSRYVKWPRYIRLQRQRAILKKRLKVPPSIHQFTNTLDKKQASGLFSLLSHYRPETKQEKRERLVKEAGEEMKAGETKHGKKPILLKFGINHIATLVEQRKAKLVVIAHDVDPIELVLWLPALCRKMDVPYVIVKGKSRLGHLVHQKTATALALTSVHKRDQQLLQQLIETTKPQFSGLKLQWGGQVLGIKRQHVIDKLEKQRQRELAAHQ